jgi:NAD(P)H-quinone oxidoreductase subunit 5
MPDGVTLTHALALLVLAAPATLVVVLGVTSLADRPLSERGTARLVRWAVSTALACALGVLIGMLATGSRHVVLDLGDWVSIDSHRADGAEANHGYHFRVKLIFDRLSVPFLMLSLVLCGTISAFAVNYMHRERGYNRFFVLYSLFVLGMVLASLAGTMETLFTGWELVGLSSALLVAFFHERPSPVRNGLRVWVVYRVSDAALLLALVVLHDMAGEGDFDKLFGTEPWPAGRASVTELQALVVGLLLVVAAVGKSALVPFSGWLPRAMEGPTPSSAVFYGALSVHLGAFLLLRMAPVLDALPALSAVVLVLGLLTATYAYLVGSVQTDIKSALSFASLAQVGLIVAEIGLGWRFIPLVHLVGHACLRTLQFLRAPTLLQDYRHLENAIGERLPRGTAFWIGFVPAGLRAWLFRLAVERGYLDALLDGYIVRPFVVAFRWLDRLERRLTTTLAGRASEAAAETPPPPREPAEPVAAGIHQGAR